MLNREKGYTERHRKYEDLVDSIGRFEIEIVTGHASYWRAKGILQFHSLLASWNSRCFSLLFFHFVTSSY
jgi:hypothetical protein